LSHCLATRDPHNSQPCLSATSYLGGLHSHITPLRGYAEATRQQLKALNRRVSGQNSGEYFSESHIMFNISGGLVKIAALTALIGGSTAESPALGNRGACGLPWAALRSFGSIYIVKACVSACTPGWLRDTIGIRTVGSDKAVGCSMSLNRKTNNRGLAGCHWCGLPMDQSLLNVLDWSSSNKARMRMLQTYPHPTPPTFVQRNPISVSHGL
jgi:hypothetical protein